MGPIRAALPTLVSALGFLDTGKKTRKNWASSSGSVDLSEARARWGYLPWLEERPGLFCICISYSPNLISSVIHLRCRKPRLIRPCSTSSMGLTENIQYLGL